MKNLSRRAFTLVELMIVIAIIGALVGLLLPAINAARERARQATCTNNQKNLAMGIFNFSTTKNRFPGWAEDHRFLGFAINSDGTSPVSWAGRILSELDDEGLKNLIVEIDNGTIYSNPPKRDIFLCPSDSERTNPDLGGLTYVVNSGMPDRTGSNPSDLKANGICHDLRRGAGGPTVTSGNIKDGSSSTLLLSENIHKDEGPTWLAPIGEQPFGMVWVYDSGSPGNPNVSLMDRFNRDTRANQAAPYAPEGSRFMRPASGHPELFIAAFCDGSVKSIRESIEYRVYQQLMTPNGAKAIDLASGDSMSGFMIPPLSDSDFK
jgi:prepilin-type N-terminal cleavage/methylation domain-containing protein